MVGWCSMGTFNDHVVFFSTLRRTMSIFAAKERQEGLCPTSAGQEWGAEDQIEGSTALNIGDGRWKIMWVVYRPITSGLNLQTGKLFSLSNGAIWFAPLWVTSSHWTVDHLRTQSHLGSWKKPMQNAHVADPGWPYPIIAPFFQWEIQDPKMEVLYHIRPYFLVIFPYIGLKNRPYIWNRYLQFRILAWPLMLWPWH